MLDAVLCPHGKLVSITLGTLNLTHHEIRVRDERSTEHSSAAVLLDDLLSGISVLTVASRSEEGPLSILIPNCAGEIGGFVRCCIYINITRDAALDEVDICQVRVTISNLPSHVAEGWERIFHCHNGFSLWPDRSDGSVLTAHPLIGAER